MKLNLVNKLIAGFLVLVLGTSQATAAPEVMPSADQEANLVLSTHSASGTDEAAQFASNSTSLMTVSPLVKGNEQISRSAAALFATQKSPGSIAVGAAEGNLTYTGEATSLYSGHTDPGNHVTNKGFCSWNRSANITVAEADKRCLASLQKKSAAIERSLTGLGIDPKDHTKALVNGADVWNQSNSAGPQFARQYKAALDMGLRGKAAYVWARVEAFRNVHGPLDASGLFGICRRNSYYQQRLAGVTKDSEEWRWLCIGIDQRRRVDEVSNALKSNIGETRPNYAPIAGLQTSGLRLATEPLNFQPMVPNAAVKKRFSPVLVATTDLNAIALDFSVKAAPTTPLASKPLNFEKADLALTTASGVKPIWTVDLKPPKTGEYVAGYLVTSPYGKRVSPISGRSHFHGGVDLGTPMNTALFAIALPGSKTTLKCWTDSNGGGLVGTMISPDFPNLKFDALHMNWCQAKTNGAGIQVAAGQIIGGTGNSGHSTGPHLHFQVRDVNTGRKIPPAKGYIHWVLTGTKSSPK